jgi:hypothetical protein
LTQAQAASSVLGTAAVILVNQPMPAASMNVRIAEGSFWLFAVVGALGARRDANVRGGAQHSIRTVTRT